MTDPLIGLTVAASATKTLRLGTGVLLIPEHHPIDLAKRISSLDFYSNGRFILGVGAGWQPEESTALGGDFPRRWAQTTECYNRSVGLSFPAQNYGLWSM
ncbi:MAG: LLM class flavin-dependent oxidoreductase, partial [Chloroflexi bacterium]|nr:LLM class flavin-dependent oxidoreductase [Chloroflexota bacterium]